MKLKFIKEIIESANINWLFGSGLSCPYLSTLNNIESLLTELESSNIEKDEPNHYLILKASIYANYVKGVMEKCLDREISKDKDTYDKVLSNYRIFLHIWNSIIAQRSNLLLGKTINIFSTNIDDFVEKAAEINGVEFNDGFKGHIKPLFREDSFTNIVSKVSTLYNNASIVPIFNYLKIHGSINWIRHNDDITYDSNLHLINQLSDSLVSISSSIIDICDKDNVKKLKTKIPRTFPFDEKNVKEFLKKCDELVMIKPRKTKFKETVIDMHFYELMRLYANTLEKSSSVLFVAGFSFADEHIANLTQRIANSNPTLHVIVFAYKSCEKINIEKNIGSINNNNVTILSADEFINDDGHKLFPIGEFDLATINNLFEMINVTI